MGSGFFPLSAKHDKDGVKLKKALDLMNEVYGEVSHLAAENDQFDNAARDGAALQRLSIAITMVDEIVEQGGG